MQWACRIVMSVEFITESDALRCTELVEVSFCRRVYTLEFDFLCELCSYACPEFIEGWLKFEWWVLSDGFSMCTMYLCLSWVYRRVVWIWEMSIEFRTESDALRCTELVEVSFCRRVYSWIFYVNYVPMPVLSLSKGVLNLSNECWVYNWKRCPAVHWACRSELLPKGL